MKRTEWQVVMDNDEVYTDMKKRQAMKYKCKEGVKEIRKVTWTGEDESDFEAGSIDREDETIWFKGDKC
jgi:hypothetical protein